LNRKTSTLPINKMEKQVGALKKSLMTHVALVEKYKGEISTLKIINETLQQSLSDCRSVSQKAQEKWVELYQKQREQIRKMREEHMFDSSSSDEEDLSKRKRLRRMRVSSLSK
jgi:hypothetical protein